MHINGTNKTIDTAHSQLRMKLNILNLTLNDMRQIAFNGDIDEVWEISVKPVISEDDMDSLESIIHDMDDSIDVDGVNLKSLAEGYLETLVQLKGDLI